MQATPWALDEFASHDIFPVAKPQAAPVEVRDEGAQLEAFRAQVEQAAYARGVADGEARARAELEEGVRSMLGALDEVVDSIRVHQARWISNAEENVAALAVAVARHVVQREVGTDNAVVTDLVQRAISQFPLDEPITVRINPEDYATLDAIRLRSERSGDLRFAADVHVARGGCLVEGRERIIDGRIDTALERLYRVIGSVQA